MSPDSHLCCFHNWDGYQVGQHGLNHTWHDVFSKLFTTFLHTKQQKNIPRDCRDKKPYPHMVKDRP